MMRTMGCLLAMLSLPVQADNEGFYDSAYGVYASVSSTTVEDMDGAVGHSSGVTRVGMTHHYAVDRTAHVESGVFYLRDAYPASADELGQDVSGFGISSLYYGRFVWTRKLRPWFGMGVSFNSITYKDRFTKDKDGFLLSSPANRDEQQTALLLSAKMVTELNRRHDIFYRFHYEHPVSNGIKGSILSIGVLFK